MVDRVRTCHWRDRQYTGCTMIGFYLDDRDMFFTVIFATQWDIHGELMSDMTVVCGNKIDF